MVRVLSLSKVFFYLEKVGASLNIDKTRIAKPTGRPKVANFSSGPCAKRPGWSLGALKDAYLGRSHRSSIGKSKLLEVIEMTHALLELPDDYRVGIVPASDTGAFEMAMWSMLGARPVDVLAWESFGHGWHSDITKQLKLNDVRALVADYGSLPDLDTVDFTHDVVFTWNGTTSGVCVPGSDWISHKREGLVLVDATSAVFAQAMDWNKTDVVTFSWQKVLGGEGAHGMIILSPRAVERLESYVPPWPLPKLFRLTKNGKLIDGIFRGVTINTPSMLCVEDCLDALTWVKSVGGVKGTISRCDLNAAILQKWISASSWADNLAHVPETRSNTSVCLKISDETVCSWSADAQEAIAKRIVTLLEDEAVAFDIGSYRDAPVGLRIWTGATVESEDISALTKWLDWAFYEARADVFEGA